MDSDYLAADRETQAKTAFLRRKESVEEALLVGWSDAAAGVGDRHRHMIVLRLCRRGQKPPPRLDMDHSHDCIAHEVEDDVLKLDSICVDLRQCPVKLGAKSNARAIELCA